MGGVVEVSWTWDAADPPHMAAIAIGCVSMTTNEVSILQSDYE